MVFSVRKNQDIWVKFESGGASDLIVGDGGIFIPDHTFRDSHDRLLVLRELIKWGREKGNQNEAVAQFQKSIEFLLQSARCVDLFDVIICYLIAESDMGFGLSLPSGYLINKYNESVVLCHKYLAKNQALWVQAEAIAERLDGLHKI